MAHKLSVSNWIKSYGPALLWGLCILIGTLLPASKLPKPPLWDFSWDKLVHFILFAILAILMIHPYFKRDLRVGKKILFAVVTFGVLYGLLLEIGQIYVPGREFSWPDLGANSLGSIAGALAYRVWAKFKSPLV